MPDNLSPFSFRVVRIRWITVVIVCIVSLVACAPQGYTVKKQTVAPTQLPTTTVYFYPTRNQSEQQQNRDRYECYLWAVKQSGFDPGQAQLAPHQRIEVTPAAPPGADTAAGAVGGAIVGSMMAPRRDPGFGLVFGAITGAMLGAASDAARQEQAARAQQYYDSKESQRFAVVERQARDYRRAMTACLEGRGYTVR